MPDIKLLSVADVEQAAVRIRDLARRTPVLTSHLFNERAGCEVFFKAEIFQRGGAFKVRGAANFLLSLTPEQRARGVVAFSSGNHAQGVAIAARDLGMPATIVMPDDAPAVKLEATRAYGARVITYNRKTEDREAIGRRLAEETGAALVPPFDHDWIIAGQGTAALELMDEVPNLEAIVTPIGGGGLLSGTGVYAKGKDPKINVIGAEPAAANDTFLSLQADKPVTVPDPQTIADGLRSPRPGDITFAHMRELVDAVVLVSEDEIKEAQAFLASRLKIVVEPSGATSAAAVFFRKLPNNPQRVGVILSGGNV